ncbi:hypothetical protein [Deferribacter abyssi]|uniref:hypothetical protein n=1 Tax=Deferribacter abyssi TaxID=213806 RepID=UPI003C269B37
MNRKITFRIKEDRLQELKNKFNHYTLRKYFSAGTSKKLLEGNANVSIEVLYKLSKLMEWDFIDFIEVIEER